MKIYLLTHEREVDRPSNTGAVALSVAGGAEGMVQRFVWSRTSPNQELVEKVKNGTAGLLYPLSEAAGTEAAAEGYENFILLDATWQEARKIYNRSPYLHAADRVSLRSERASRYRLRRNQKRGGLCTAECVIEVLRAKGQEALADEIENAFDAFNAGL